MSKPIGKPIMFTLEEIQEADDAQCGFCIECGATCDSCEPDARNRKCDVCGKFTAFGAEELIIMGRVK